MKFIILTLLYVFTFMGLFFLLSTIGILWADSYLTVIKDGTWFAAYTMFIGWWWSLLCCRDYIVNNEEYFEDYF
jgi:hypothetical protein